MKSKPTETWHLDEETVGPIIRAAYLGEKKSYKKGDFLYHQGSIDNKFYFILKGRIQIFSGREDGSDFVLEVMGRWAICGEGAAFDGKPRFSSAVAAEDTEVVIFNANHVKHAFKEVPEFAVALLKIASLKQRVLGVRAQYLASSRPESRVAELLKRLGELYGEETTEGILIQISLSHEQIAAMTGTTRVTITRVIKRLKEQNILDVKSKKIIILDMNRLF